VVDAEAELRRALELQRQGLAAEADACLLRVLGQDPGNFGALLLRGVLLAQGGRLEEAAVSLQRAAAVRPDAAAAHLNLSAVLIDLQRFTAALECVGRALALQPDSLQALLNEGAALRGLGRPEEARRAYERALAHHPRSSLALRLHADLLLESGAPAEALASYERAARLGPDDAFTHAGAGMALLQLQRPREALDACRRSLTIDASRAVVHANCAAALLALGRAAEALESSGRALALQGDLFEAHCNQGASLLALHRYAAALAAYDRALTLRPQSTAALCGRGQACREMAERQAAYEAYRLALELDPDDAAAHVGLLLTAVPVIAGSSAEVDASRLRLADELRGFDAWSAGRALDEPGIVIHIPAFYLAYQERSNRELLGAWGSIATRLMGRWLSRTQTAGALSPHTGADGRVRLGIVTAHAYEHSVFRALLRGWLEHLDGARVQLCVFDLAVERGAATALARRHAEWVDCSALSLAECVGEISRRDCDALLYPEIGMDGRTVQLASLRLAAHQIASWGHPQTTGLPTIDHFLSADAFESADAQLHYTERLVRLPGIGCHYEPYELAARALAALPEIPAGVPLLISAGTPYKYAPEYDCVLVEVAAALGRCRILLFDSEQAHLSRRVLQRLRTAFLAAGLDPDQFLLMLPWQSVEGFHALLRRADLYLDTPGFSGFNTVMHALECELPIVAYEGQFMRGRFASGVLRGLGLEELIAVNPADYVRLTVALARDRAWRESLRSRIAGSRATLYRNRAPVDALSDWLAQLRR